MAVTIATSFLVRDSPWWKVWLAAYAIGGTCSQNLFCAQHELSHFLAFKKPIYNRFLSFASNCPLVVPMATAFRKYHQEHHSHLVSGREGPVVFSFSVSSSPAEETTGLFAFFPFSHSSLFLSSKYISLGRRRLGR